MNAPTPMELFLSVSMMYVGALVFAWALNFSDAADYFRLLFSIFGVAGVIIGFYNLTLKK